MEGMKRLAIALAAAVLVTGCSSQTVGTSTPTPTKIGAVKYESLTDLRDAAIKAGYRCVTWTQDNRVTAAAESGSCSDSDVFSIYITEADTSAAATRLKAIGGETHLLVGPNWIINADSTASVTQLKNALGGTAVLGS